MICFKSNQSHSTKQNSTHFLFTCRGVSCPSKRNATLKSLLCVSFDSILTCLHRWQELCLMTCRRAGESVDVTL